MTRAVLTTSRLRNCGCEVLAERDLMKPEGIKMADISEVLVDTEATRLVLTGTLVRRLGLMTAGEIGVRYADNRIERKTIARSVPVKMIGRFATFDAIVESEGQPLTRMGVLESLGLWADIQHVVLTTNPESLHQPLYNLLRIV